MTVIDKNKRGFFSRLKFAGLCIIVVLIAIEISLRVFIGLGTTPLFYANPIYGYAYVPDQSVTRFGNKMYVNHEGLRSDELDKRTRVLCLGDSVTNGGILTDQSQTYPSLLEADLKHSGKDVQVLNAGAGGWAPSNEEGFLGAKGIFGAKVVVLEIGTNDFWQEKAESSLVGTLSYPDHKPLLAVTELVNRYLWPRIAAKVLPHHASESYRPVNSAVFDNNLKIINAMIDEAQQQGAKVEVLIVPFADEIKPGYKDARDVDAARERIKALCAVRKVSLVDARPALSQSSGKIFRDEVHPNEAGNKVLADELLITVQKDLQ